MKKLLVGILLVGIFAIGASATSITYWSGSLSQDMQEIVLKMFAEKCPEIKVEFEFVPQGNMADKVLLAAAADEPPDVILGYEGRNVAYFYQNLLEPLNETLTQEEIDDFLPGLLDIYTVDRTLFSYPTYQVVITYLANKTLLEKAGVWNSIPEDREITFDTWMEVAEAVTQFPDTFACPFHAQGKGGDYYMLQYFQIFGANQYEKGDYTRTTLNSEAGIRALEWMVDIANRGWSPPGPAGMSSVDVFKSWITGRVAFFGGTPPQAMEDTMDQYIQDGSAPEAFEIVVVQTPHISDISAPGLFPSATTTVVFKQDDLEKRDAAITFAKFLSGSDCLGYIATATRNIPARKSVATDLFEIPAFQFTMDLLGKVGMADLGVNSPYYLDVRLARYPELQAAFMGQKTPKQALDDFAKAVEAMWKEK